MLKILELIQSFFYKVVEETLDDPVDAILETSDATLETSEEIATEKVIEKEEPKMKKTKLSKSYAWLKDEKAPKILLEALKEHGVLEAPGKDNNPHILAWAKEVGGWVADYYQEDSIPWCGLFMGVVAKRAGYPFNQKMLTAKEWLNWGVPVKQPMLGDVLVFGRTGGGHVGIYIAEDAQCYHVLGGNQSDSVNITRINKDRFLGARRSKFKIGQPKNVRKIYMNGEGMISENES